MAINTLMNEQEEDLQNVALMLENEDGSVDISTTEEELMDEMEDATEESPFYENLVSKLDDEELEKIGSTVIGALDADEESRSAWMETLTKGFDILGIGIEELNEPFEGACSASHPLIIESAIKFQAKAGSELLPPDGPVKTQVLGNVTRELEEQATRVRDFMNFQTTTMMTEYYPDKEKMLFYLPLIGSAFTKTYYSESEGRPLSEFIPVDQFVVSYNASDLERAKRYSHIIYRTRDDLKRDVAEGLYDKKAFKELDPEPGMVQLSEFQQKQGKIVGHSPNDGEYDSCYTLIEQHVSMYLPSLDKDDMDGVAKPYIITVDKDSETVLGIRRNWDEGDTKYKKKINFTHYPFVPGLGFYGLGYIHLLGNLQMTLTSALRALVDSAQFANLQGGFKTKALRIAKDQGGGALAPGEWRDVESAGQKLSEAFFPVPYKEPSPTLLNLLQAIEAKGLKFADSTEQVVADSTNYGPVGTTMALLDASTKFFSAAHRRLHFSQKKELNILAKINQETLDEQIEYHIPGSTLVISPNDFGPRIDILPVSDPNISSNAHRITLETTKTQMVQQLNAMNHVNMKELLRRQFLALGEKDIDKIIPPDEEVQPNDPVSDIIRAVSGKPIKAFAGQNHDAHMQVKQSWLMDPMNGGSPMMQPFAPAIQANLREHAVMKYQEQISGGIQNTTGAATDQNTMEMVIAEAAQQLATANQQAQLEQIKGTPEFMIAEAEALKARTDAAELDHKKKKDFASAVIDTQKLNLEAIKEANRHNEAKETLMAGLTKDKMKLGKDLTLSALKGLDSSRQKEQNTKN
jgi:hypothetical protein